MKDNFKPFNDPLAVSKWDECPHCMRFTYKTYQGRTILDPRYKDVSKMRRLIDEYRCENCGFILSYYRAGLVR